MRVVIIGSQGKMGQATVKAITEDSALELVGTVDLGDDLAQTLSTLKPDVAIDFTRPDTVFENAKTVIACGVFGVIGTTGLGENELAELDRLSREKGVAVAVCPNFAIGAVLMMAFSAKAAKYMPQVEIIEYHHDQKLDAPSGTAIKTKELILSENPGVQDIPISSVRLKGIIANQDVIFGGEGQTLTLSHRTVDRSSFMPGVVLVVKSIKERLGLVYGLEHFLEV